jgi:hypothetical protein
VFQGDDWTACDPQGNPVAGSERRDRPRRPERCLAGRGSHDPESTGIRSVPKAEAFSGAALVKKVWRPGRCADSMHGCTLEAGGGFRRQEWSSRARQPAVTPSVASCGVDRVVGHYAVCSLVNRARQAIGRAGARRARRPSGSGPSWIPLPRWSRSTVADASAEVRQAPPHSRPAILTIRRSLP